MSVPGSVIFNPNWWFRNYGISFGREFYLDAGTRISNDVRMRRALYDRFGLGAPYPESRPVIGSRHVAGGFVVPALLGAEIRFARDQAPWPVPRNLGREEALALRKPPVAETWPMSALLADMDLLERRFGRVIGDLNTDGVLNTALVLRGQELFLDMLEAPEAADHLFRLVAETQAEVACLIRSRTGTTSVSTNRCILHADAEIYLHSNCSVQMIAPRLYRERLLPFERELAGRLAPYGIHHCGNNLHLFTEAYSEVPCAFVDVGWGSDVARCSRAFPDAFLNLRLSPVRMLHETAEQIRRDAEDLLCRSGRTANVGLCCINMDYGTPDENVKAMLETGG
jgi:hypothetical protein